MANKKNANYFSKYIKKSSLAGLTIVLTWIFFQLGNHFPLLQSTSFPSSDSPIELYSNQTSDDLTQLFSQAIESAKTSITVVIYSLTDPHIIQALHKKSQENITVTITCDAKASPGISKHLPYAKITKCFGQGLMHQKIIIIDNQQIWLGSANFTPSSLCMHGNLVMGIHHPSLAEALTVRTASMDEDRTVGSPILHCETKAGDQTIELWVLPDDPTAVDRMIELFRSAKKTIKVAMFTWTRTDFASEMIAASQRGVHVEAVLDRNQAKATSAKILKMLQKNGISVSVSQGPGLLHHKFVYIDDSILVNGSANWTKAAFQDNDDNFVIVYPLMETQKNKMDQLWKAVQSS